MSAIKISGHFHKRSFSITKVKIFAAVVLLGLFISGCDNIIGVDSQAQQVTAEVQLRDGFQRHYVSVSCDSQIDVEAVLAYEVPLTEPLATFNFDVPSGAHELQVCWVPFNGNKEAGVSAVDVELERAGTYQVNLNLSGDSIGVSIQANPLTYM